MKLRHSIAALLVFLLTAFLLGLWLRTPAAPSRIQLSNGGEMRILKVSLGTNHFLSAEPFWKQCLRAVLPEVLEKPLGPFQGEQLRTRWDTLVVWVEGSQPSARFPFAVGKPEAVFANGVTVAGKVRARQGLARLVFPCFERESHWVPLKVQHSTNSILFHVNNPKPVKPASWASLRLPQTQSVNKAVVVFNRFRFQKDERTSGLVLRPSVLVRGSQPAGHGPVYWWSATAFDRWGNYTEAGYDGGAPPSLGPLPPNRGPWRLRVEGEEYLSAGIIPQPSNELSLVLAPSPRMQELGIRFLLWVGPGTYTLTNGFLALQTSKSFHAQGGGISRFQFGTGTNPSAFQLTTPVPGVLCLSEMLPAIPRPRMRLHERGERRQERILYGQVRFSATNSVDSTNYLAQFIAAPLPGIFTNHFELEMISDIGADFLVAPPQGD